MRTMVTLAERSEQQPCSTPRCDRGLGHPGWCRDSRGERLRPRKTADVSEVPCPTCGSTDVTRTPMPSNRGHGEERITSDCAGCGEDRGDHTIKTKGRPKRKDPVTFPKNNGTFEAKTAIAVGDRVTRGDGTMQGTVKRILDKGYSNGGLPMASVEWDSGASGLVTVKQLAKVAEAAPVLHTRHPDRVRLCRQCGEENGYNAVICGSCHHPLRVARNTATIEA